MGGSTLLRIRNIVKAEIESVLSQIENPKKMVNQLLIDMERAFDQAVGEVSRAIANKKMIERRLTVADKETVRLQAKAEEAVTQGDNEAAHGFLEAKIASEAASADLNRAYEEAQSASSYLRTQLSELRTKLESARNRKNTIAVRSASTRTTDSRPSPLDRRPFDAFDRLCDDVDRDEIAAEVLEGILEQKVEDLDLDKLERTRKAKTELDNLKRRVNKEEE